MRSEELARRARQGFRNVIFSLLIIFMSAGISFASDLIDSSVIKFPAKINEMHMSGFMPNYKGTGSFNDASAQPDFNLSRMKSVNPDFTTYPDEYGIIWQKYVDVSHSEKGLEITRLYVILGRQGINKKWLTWNIPVPANGEAEILLSDVYDFTNLAKISTEAPKYNEAEGIKVINFVGLPESFILAVAWRETLPKQLSVEGICWFQEDLRVWESVVDIHSTHKLEYETFPAIYPSETEYINGEHSYAWRRINVDPYASGELARMRREGVIFGTRKSGAVLSGMLKEIENTVNISAPAEAGTTPQRIVSWLMKKQEIELAEGTARTIPSIASPLTKKEKILLAKSWLTAKNFNVTLDWQLPFEPDEDTPLCMDMFSSPVLEFTGVKGLDFHAMNDPRLLAGAKIFGFNADAGKLTSRRVPSSKSGDNRLSAIMDLQLSDKGLLSGNIRIILRGSWAGFILGDGENDAETLQAAVLSLFPDLRNYSDINFKKHKGVPEISFKIENKPGVAGSGTGILAVLPFFEPIKVRKLGVYEPPVEVLFPFIIDQNINLAYPDNIKESLISGKVDKGPDKINYSHSYSNRRRRLIAEARLEVGLNQITSGNMTALRRCLDQWRAFSARNIPVR